MEIKKEMKKKILYLGVIALGISLISISTYFLLKGGITLNVITFCFMFVMGVYLLMLIAKKVGKKRN